MRKFVGFIGGLVLLAGLVTAGCGGEGSSSANDTDPRVEAVNLTGAALTLQVDDDVAANGLAAYSAGGTRFPVDPDVERDYNLKPASGDDLWTETFKLAKSKDFLAIAYGSANYGSEPIKRVRIALPEINREAPNGLKSRLYFFNGYLPDAGTDPFSLDFRTPGDPAQWEKGDVAYGELDTLEVDSGALTFTVRRNGTETVVATVSQTFQPGRIYLIAATGTEGAAGGDAPALRVFSLSNK